MQPTDLENVTTKDKADRVRAILAKIAAERARSNSVVSVLVEEMHAISIGSSYAEVYLITKRNSPNAAYFNSAMQKSRPLCLDANKRSDQ